MSGGSGTSTSDSALNRVRTTSRTARAASSKQLPKQALTHGVVYPFVKKVAQQLGVHMTTGIFAKGVAKVVPVVGGVLSGGLTLATFLPMAKRLKKHLANLEVTTAGTPSAPDAAS